MTTIDSAISLEDCFDGNWSLGNGEIGVTSADFYESLVNYDRSVRFHLADCFRDKLGRLVNLLEENTGCSILEWRSELHPKEILEKVITVYRAQHTSRLLYVEIMTKSFVSKFLDKMLLLDEELHSFILISTAEDFRVAILEERAEKQRELVDKQSDIINQFIDRVKKFASASDYVNSLELRIATSTRK